MYELCIEDHFSAAHNLRNYKGKCENLHGHNYRVQVFIRGRELDRNGLLADFVKLKKALKKELDKFDHKYLNEIPPFTKLNPTAENIARHIFDNYKLQMANYRLRIARVIVWESETSSASYNEK